MYPSMVCYSNMILGFTLRCLFHAALKKVKQKSNQKATEKTSKRTYTKKQTLSKYNSVVHVEIIVIWHLSSLERLSSFRNKKVLKESWHEVKKKTHDFISLHIR